MDINVRITLDASDKLAQMVFAVAAMVIPELEDTETEPAPAPKSEPKPAPAPAPAPKSEPKPEPAPTSEPALEPKPKLYGVYAMAESLASAPATAPAPAPEPAPAPVQNDEQVKALTIDDVRRVCLRATKAGKTKVVTDFLDAQGVKNLPALDPKRYDALVKVVEDNL